jgi:hypothetical protein
VTSQSLSNPEEIEIDDIDDDVSGEEVPGKTKGNDRNDEMPLNFSGKSKFETLFGVGPFYKHPSIRSYFGVLSLSNKNNFCRETQVLEHLLQYLSNQAKSMQLMSLTSLINNNSMNDTEDFNSKGLVVGDFVSYMCSMEGVVDMVNELGVIVRTGSRDGVHGLEKECDMMRHVMRLRSQRHISFLNEAMQQQQDQQHNNSVSKKQVKKKKKKNAKQADNQKANNNNNNNNDNINEHIESVPFVISLKRPSRDSICHFIDACSSNTEGTYSPSFSKIRQAITTLLPSVNLTINNDNGDDDDDKHDNAAGAVGVDSGASKHTKKKRKNCRSVPILELNNGEKDWLSSVIDAASEYALLHIGSKKHRQKAFDYCYSDEYSAGVDVGNRFSDETANVEEEEEEEEDEVSISGDSVSDKEDVVEEEEQEEANLKADNSKYDKLKNYSNSKANLSPFNPNEDEEEEEEEEEIRVALKVKDPINMWDITVTPIMKNASKNIDDDTQDDDTQGDNHVIKSFHNNNRMVCNNNSNSSATPWGQPPLVMYDKKAVGRWGESFVFQLLLKKFPPETGAVVTWMNQDKETLSPFDIKVTFNHGSNNKKVNNCHGGGGDTSLSELTGWFPDHHHHHHPRRNQTIFIEVKSTSADRLDTFDLSLQEWEFFTKSVSSSLVTYHIYRVYNAGNPDKVRVRVVSEVLANINAKKVRLCLRI